MINTRIFNITLYIITICVVFYILWSFPKWTVDDAFIYFRYAKNLADHGELNWNVGENPVEGYTGVLYPVLLAIFMKIGISPIVVSQSIGVLSFLIGGLIIFLFLGKLIKNEIIRNIVLIVYFSSPFMYTHAFGGIETLLFSTSVMTSVFFMFNYFSFIKNNADRNKSKRKQILFISMLLITSLIRPEGVVFAGLAIIFYLLYFARFKKKNLKPFVINIIFFFILPGFLYFCWRWNYYEQFLPNTYYAKCLGGFISTSITKLFNFFAEYISIPTVIIVLFLASETDSIWKDLKRNEIYKNFLIVLSLGLLFLIVITCKYMRSNLMMNYSHRFFIPHYLLFLTGFGVLVDQGFRYLFQQKKSQPIKFKFVFIITLVLISAILIKNFKNGRYEVSFTSRYKNLIQSEHIPLGRFLKENIPSKEYIIVHIDAGAIPFYSQLKTVDFGGLNDEILSKRTLNIDEQVNYFFSFNPGAVVFTSYDWERVSHTPRAELILKDNRFKKYFLVKKYRSHKYPNYYQFLYVRNDLIKK